MSALHASCLDCGYRFDASSAIGGDGPRTPGEGDVSICIQCGAVALYRLTPFGLGLRKPTPVEWLDIHAEHGDLIATVQAGIEQVQGR